MFSTERHLFTLAHYSHHSNLISGLLIVVHYGICFIDSHTSNFDLHILFISSQSLFPVFFLCLPSFLLSIFFIILFSKTLLFNYSFSTYISLLFSLSLLFFLSFPTLSINLTFFFNFIPAFSFFFFLRCSTQFFPVIFSFIIFLLLYSNYISCLSFSFPKLAPFTLSHFFFYFFSVFFFFLLSFIYFYISENNFLPIPLLSLFFLRLIFPHSFFTFILLLISFLLFFHFFFSQSLFITRLAQGTGNSGSRPGRHHTALSCVWNLPNKK